MLKRESIAFNYLTVFAQYLYIIDKKTYTPKKNKNCLYENKI